MVTVTMTIEEYEALMDLVRSANGNMSLATSPMAEASGPKPKKRKRSKYNRELSKQLKDLKKKHPRTKVTSLMKRAHRATRKALKL
jgi:hypothetical protein